MLQQQGWTSDASGAWYKPTAPAASSAPAGYTAAQPDWTVNTPAMLQAQGWKQDATGNWMKPTNAGAPSALPDFSATNAALSALTPIGAGGPTASPAMGSVTGVGAPQQNFDAQGNPVGGAFSSSTTATGPGVGSAAGGLYGSTPAITTTNNSTPAQIAAATAQEAAHSGSPLATPEAIALANSQGANYSPDQAVHGGGINPNQSAPLNTATNNPLDVWSTPDAQGNSHIISGPSLTANQATQTANGGATGGLTDPAGVNPAVPPATQILGGGFNTTVPGSSGGPVAGAPISDLGGYIANNNGTGYNPGTGTTTQPPGTTPPTTTDPTTSALNALTPHPITAPTVNLPAAGAPADANPLGTNNSSMDFINSGMSAINKQSALDQSDAERQLNETMAGRGLGGYADSSIGRGELSNMLARLSASKATSEQNLLGTATSLQQGQQGLNLSASQQQLNNIYQNKALDTQTQLTQAAQHLQAQGMTQQDAQYYAGLAQDANFRQQAQSLEAQGMTADQAYRTAALNQQGAQNTAQNTLQTGGLDLNRINLMLNALSALEGTGSAGTLSPDAQKQINDIIANLSKQ